MIKSPRPFPPTTPLRAMPGGNLGAAAIARGAAAFSRAGAPDLAPPAAASTGLPAGLLRVISARRGEAIAALVAQARGIEHAHGADAAGLDLIGDLLVDLAAQLPLFPREHLPPGPDGITRYRLHEEADGRFALHAVLVPPGRTLAAQEPGWAVLAVVRGLAEASVLRSGHDHRPPPATEPYGPGEALALRPGDLLHLAGDAGPVLCVMLHGLSPDRQPTPLRGAPRPPAARPLPLQPAEVMAAMREREAPVLLDLREEAAFIADGHPPGSVCAPLSCLGAMIGAIVPEGTARIVLTDADGTLTRAGAERLARLGYRNVAALAGGAQGWKAAGFPLSHSGLGLWGPSEPDG